MIFSAQTVKKIILSLDNDFNKDIKFSIPAYVSFAYKSVETLKISVHIQPVVCVKARMKIWNKIIHIFKKSQKYVTCILEQ